jgi:hypothetical protein
VSIRVTGLGLYLREWTDDDLPVMVELFDDPAVAQWTPLASPFDLTAARNYLDQARTRRAEGHSVHRRRPLGEQRPGDAVVLNVTFDFTQEGVAIENRSVAMHANLQFEQLD